MSEMIVRGRPAGQMTHRRRQVLAEYEQAAARGETPRLAELARRCGFYSYREAKRALRSMKALGQVI